MNIFVRSIATVANLLIFGALGKEYIKSIKYDNEDYIEEETYKMKYFNLLEGENEFLRGIFHNNALLSIKSSISGTKFTKEEIESIKELYEKRYSIRRIAKIVNRSSSRIQNYIKK